MLGLGPLRSPRVRGSRHFSETQRLALSQKAANRGFGFGILGLGGFVSGVRWVCKVCLCLCGLLCACMSSIGVYG